MVTGQVVREGDETITVRVMSYHYGNEVELTLDKECVAYVLGDTQVALIIPESVMHEYGIEED